MRSLLIVGAFIASGAIALGQQLDPRAYSISPTGVNIAILAYGYSTGDLNFDPALPIDRGRAQINTVAAGWFRSIAVLGRSANIAVSAPYIFGNLQGVYLGEFTRIYRSGWGDSYARFAINLHGARAMKLKEFVGFRQQTNLGVSLVVSVPTGQYDPAKAINVGTNRWAFKPEVGLSHAFKKTRLILDAYQGIWFYTPNNNFRGGRRQQEAITSSQFHLSYDIKPRLWVALDANFFTGGRTTIDGVRRNDLQTNSRVGGTISAPVTRHQSVKFAYARGAYTTVGGAFQTFSFSYQYLWGGGL